MPLLRALAPLLAFVGAAALLPRAAVAGRGVHPAGPGAALLLGAALALALGFLRAQLLRAAARAGAGPREPALRFTAGTLEAVAWVVAIVFALVALLPLLPDRAIPGRVALAGLFLLALRALAAARGRREPPPRGEERHWRAGVFYLNPRDREALVPSRLGVGYTLNLGRPLGWLLLAVAVGLPALAARWLAAGD